MNITRSLALFVGVTVLLAGCATAPTTSLPEQSTILPERGTITLSGEGKIDTAKFVMSGDYIVRWQTLHDCSYYVNLEPGYVDVFAATAPLTGTNNVYGLAAGTYYFHVNTGPTPLCGWSLTLTPVN